MLLAGNTLELSASGMSAKELFFRNLVKKDGVESLKASPWFKSVSVTTTNLILQFSLPGGGLWIWSGDDSEKGSWTEEDDEFFLTPDQETKLSTLRHTKVIFTPTSFENQMKGFRILHLTDDRLGGYITTCLGYVALSDPPIEVHEDDVEMILENGEWIKFGKEGEAQVSPPSREDKKTSANIAEDEPSEEKSKASHFWLYVILFHLILFPCLYFIRKKLSRKVQS